jgi:hypothetical protein
VRVDGSEPWAIALRAVMLAIDQGTDRWQGGAQLPKTVGIRAPKASTLEDKDIFSWTDSNDARDELELTLRAADMGISPPVYAAFPVKVYSEKLGTIASRQMAYVYEDGWLDLANLLHHLGRVHIDAAELAAAKKSIARETDNLLSAVAHDAGWFMMDIKLLNMVGRRKPNTIEYEVRMIDFACLWTGEANRHSEERATSPDCIYVVNGILFLSQLATTYSEHMAMYKPLAETVADVYYGMAEDDDSFCALLKKDDARLLEPDWPDSDTLLATEDQAYHWKLLRGAFYRMLHNYGNGGTLLPKADSNPASGPGFVERFVKHLEQEYKNVS